MGYFIKQLSTEFVIQGEHSLSALAAIKLLANRAPIEDQSGSHFSFVETTAFLNADTLEDGLIAWRWRPELIAEDGTILEIRFTGQKLGDDDILFAALAPYVESGSYITVVGEGEGGDEFWRWIFDGQHVYHVNGQAEFEEPTFENQLDLDQLPGIVVFKSKKDQR
jgi:hypothetical protein